MFACLYSVSSPAASLVTLAEAFTPRFEVIGPLVMLDISGLSRLIGSPQEIGEQLRRAAAGPVRIAVAPTQTAAALLVLGRAGLTVVLPDEQIDKLAALPVTLLGRAGSPSPGAGGQLRLLGASAACGVHRAAARGPHRASSARWDRHVGEMWDALPYFESTLDRTSELASRRTAAAAAAVAAAGSIRAIRMSRKR